MQADLAEIFKEG